MYGEIDCFVLEFISVVDCFISLYLMVHYLKRDGGSFEALDGDKKRQDNDDG